MKLTLFLAVGLCAFAPAQQLDFPRAAATDPAQLSKAMPVLAKQALAIYQEPDREKFLGNVFRMQMVAQDYASALTTIQTLRALNANSPVRRRALLFNDELYAKAKLQETSRSLSFQKAFTQVFRETYFPLDDITDNQYGPFLTYNLEASQQDIRKSLDAQKEKDGLSLADALELIRMVQLHESYKEMLPLAGDLLAEDEQRRYLIQDVLVKTPDGASISALVVRPKQAKGPLPTAFNFTIYTYPRKRVEAEESAAHGFVGVVAYTRGKRFSPDQPVPYEHDGSDATAVIDWISKQPWSDGKVGMYGGSYEGFTQWAAAKRMHPALKAIMPSVPVAPGIDIPMEGNVFETFVYKWLPYVTNLKGLDEADYNSDRWNKLDWTWFNSGKPYRDLALIDGRPNPIFDRWLNHPGYDAYWQAMIPYRDEFARINIPVLITTGYYDGCSISATYYLSELTKYNPNANVHFLIGPYNHIGGQHQSQDVLLGYSIDPAARIDFHALRYQWLDHTLRGGPKPAALKGRINYEVMGANEWKAAPSVAAMSNGTLKLYLHAVKAGSAFLLSEAEPDANSSLRLQVDLEDRSTLSFGPPMLILDKTVDSDNGFAFASKPLPAPMEVSGLFSGQLKFITNKKDLDLNVVLYELTPKGEYFLLSNFIGRASYVRDRSKRQLLTPGEPQTLTFSSGRPTSCRMEAGSQIVVALTVNKQPRMQLNYGTGKDVSDESIADGKVPLDVTLLPGSYINLPIWK